MPFAQTQVTIWPTSNLLADASTNTWSVEYLDLTGLGAAHTALSDFYKALVTLFPDTVRQNNHEIVSYDRSDPIPRAPILSTTWNFTGAPTGNPNAPEVAMCCSFQGVLASGSPQSRRRGRIYLGPLRSTLVGTDGRPTSASITLLRNAANTLLTASDAATDWIWTVHSTVNGNDTPVDNGWVDNEFDTQRRRGRVATSRTTF